MDKIVFGTWGMSSDSYGPANENDLSDAVREFLSQGGDTFETASSYGMNREGEKLLARFLSDYWGGGKNKPKVITKIGNLPHVGQDMPQNWERGFLTKQIDIAEKIFGKFLDGILMHSPPAVPEIYEVGLETLAREMGDRGLKFGVALRTVSDFGNDEVMNCIARYKPNLVTVNYSAMDQRLDTAENISLLNDSVDEIWARTVFNFGFLANPSLKIFPTRDHRNTWPSEQIEKWRQGGNLFQELGKNWQMTPSQLAIGFALSNAMVDRVCLGMSSADEVKTNFYNTGGNLPPHLLHEITQLYAENEFFLR